MSNDTAVIQGLRQAQRLVCGEYAKAFADFAGGDISDAVRNILDEHLLTAKKLAELEKQYSVRKSPAYPTAEEIKLFLQLQENADKSPK